MSYRDLSWSKTEKTVARKAYDLAYRREMENIKSEIISRAADIKEPAVIWALHDYLTDRRREIDRKYDYRYSVLIRVFADLICDGYLKPEELEGLREEKIEMIMKAKEILYRNTQLYKLSYGCVDRIEIHLHILNSRRSTAVSTLRNSLSCS
jgi:hypothetical protein